MIHPAQKQAMHAVKRTLVFHPLYGQLKTPEALRCFMAYHAFCVWDFMSLLKSLQAGLTCVQVPWVPSPHPQLARLINEIVLDEESDEIEGMGCFSHFDLYRSAMAEIGCNLAPLDTFVAAMQSGASVEDAMETAQVPFPVRSFVRNTFSVIGRPLRFRAAVFFYSREDLIPDMFLQMVQGLMAQGLPCHRLLAYMNRHVEMDQEKHGPRAQQLIQTLFAECPEDWAVAEQLSIECLQARATLWDAILAEITIGQPEPVLCP